MEQTSEAMEGRKGENFNKQKLKLKQKELHAMDDN